MEWDGASYLNYACFCFIKSISPTRTFEESSSLYLHTAGYAAQTEGRMIRCVQKKEQCLHQKYAYLLINSTDFRYTLKSWNYVHREQEWFSPLAVPQASLWFRIQHQLQQLICLNLSFLVRKPERLRPHFRRTWGVIRHINKNKAVVGGWGCHTAAFALLSPGQRTLCWLLLFVLLEETEDTFPGSFKNSNVPCA